MSMASPLSCCSNLLSRDTNPSDYGRSARLESISSAPDDSDLCHQIYPIAFISSRAGGFEGLEVE